MTSEPDNDPDTENAAVVVTEGDILALADAEDNFRLYAWVISDRDGISGRWLELHGASISFDPSTMIFKVMPKIVSQ